MGDNESAQTSTAMGEVATSTTPEPIVDANSEDADKEKKQEGQPISPEAAPVEDSGNTEQVEETKGEKVEETKPAETTIKPGMKRPPYVYDPEKITLRFLFANRDGLSVMVKCDPSDTVGEVKGALLSVWPDELQGCSGGDSLRLICMGKGILMPDSRTLQDCQVPVFRTHPTPVNVAVRPAKVAVESRKPVFGSNPGSSTSANDRGAGTSNVTGQGCACVIL